MDLEIKEMLSSRERKIFQSVIQEYILTAEPVSSRRISKKYNLNLSPASIRNVMGDLEEIGFFYQPHTSAGRIPTDKGFRFYVDIILKNRELSLLKKEAIRGKYQKTSLEVSTLMKETSKILSEFSNSTGIVMAPKFIDTVFRRIEFVLLKRGQILTIFVSQSGLLQNKIIEIDEENISQDDLDKFSRYLNEILFGLNLREVRHKILEEMKKERNIYNKLLSRALKLGQSALGGDFKVEVYVEGQLNLLDYPEFAEAEKMKALLKAFGEKSILLKILDKAMEGKGLQIFIGSENVEKCSFILSSYSRDRDVLGSLGVVGPTRMNYFNIIPVVGYIAKLLSDFLEEK
ncbi:MAG: heat-inducible transcription repressor HrcA [Deltaproteobacteria bacterium]|nr:heat-inducible transcription repressor HrcA [Deltaproteobacteria bacterium]